MGDRARTAARSSSDNVVTVVRAPLRDLGAMYCEDQLLLIIDDEIPSDVAQRLTRSLIRHEPVGFSRRRDRPRVWTRPADTAPAAPRSSLWLVSDSEGAAG